MALSGDAFNLCFASHWQATGYLGVPTDTLSNVAGALGYDQRWLLPMSDPEIRALPEEDRRRVTDQVLQQMREEIDEGRPVLIGGSGDQGCGPWSVVVGYDWNRRPFATWASGSPTAGWACAGWWTRAR